MRQLNSILPWLVASILLVLLTIQEAEAVRRIGGRVKPLVSLRISEIMYHPPVADGEFLELQNTGDDIINLSGISFSDGIDYSFPGGTVVEPGGYVVLVASEETFAALYPGVAYTGEYDGRLDNAGETITLSYSGELVLLSMTYDDADPWPAAADGEGYSLVAVNPDANLDDPASWRLSSGLGGSPGGDDIDPGIPRVLVNEALTHTDLPQMDAVEIYNPTDETADIRGWLLSDDRRNPAKALIPDDSQYVLGPGAYAVLYEDVFADSPGSIDGVDLPGFRLDSHGDEGIYLFSADSAGRPTGYAHGFSIDAAENGVSFGRYLTSEGKTHFVAQQAVTLGTANSGPKIGPVVIREIFYHPPTDGIEYLALDNSSDEEVHLWDDDPDGNPDNTWVIRGIGFAFAPGTTIPAHGRILVVNSDPVTFRSHYSVPDSIAIQGPFGNAANDNDAALDNGGETVTLRWPDVPDEEIVPWVAMDRVGYDDRDPWPDADGNGLALRRIALDRYGNDPASWQAAQPCFQPEGCGEVADPSDALYPTDRLLSVDIEIAEEDWQTLCAQERNLYQLLLGDDCMAAPFGDPFTYFPGRITVDGTVISNVGIRKKGFLGSMSRDKPSLKIKLDEYIDGQRLAGLQLLTLNNALQDARYLNQCIGYQLFAEAGVPASRCSFALVRVNGRELGIYAHVESVKRPLLARSFASSGGDLYEGTLSDFRPGWLGTFEHKQGPGIGAGSLAALASTLELPDEELVEALQPLVDLDAFLTFWAMEVLLGHWDGYAGNTNNFYLYHDPSDGRLHFIPWGIDALLSDDNPFGSAAGTTGVLAYGILARRLYRHAPTRQLYVDRLRSLLDTVWDETAITAEINRMASLLLPHTAAAQRAGFNSAVDQAIDFVLTRRQELLSVLEPQPPEWQEELRNAFCFSDLGEASGSFRTYWGSLGTADPFANSSGSITAVVNGAALPFIAVGAAAGPEGGIPTAEQAAVAVIGAHGDGTFTIVYFLLHHDLLAAGVTLPLDGEQVQGFLLTLDESVSPEPQIFGLLAEGSISFSEAEPRVGRAIAGSFTASLFKLAF